MPCKSRCRKISTLASISSSSSTKIGLLTSRTSTSRNLHVTNSPLLTTVPPIDKKTIVFDLDETLIRAQREEFTNGYNQRVTVVDQNQNNEGMSINEYYVRFYFCVCHRFLDLH